MINPSLLPLKRTVRSPKSMKQQTMAMIEDEDTALEEIPENIMEDREDH